jgi:hypothetical protein
MNTKARRFLAATMFGIAACTLSPQTFAHGGGGDAFLGAFLGGTLGSALGGGYYAPPPREVVVVQQPPYYAPPPRQVVVVREPYYAREVVVVRRPGPPGRGWRHRDWDDD